jgi:hypothetical protein
MDMRREQTQGTENSSTRHGGETEDEMGINKDQAGKKRHAGVCLTGAYGNGLWQSCGFNTNCIWQSCGFNASPHLFSPPSQPLACYLDEQRVVRRLVEHDAHSA